MTNQVLGTFDPSLLRNGFYTLRLSATEVGRTTTVIALRGVRVDGELKVGHFTLSMQDVAAEVAGVPVVISRTYDSRDSVGGEFGPGWRLDLRSADLEVKDCTDVAVTMPDGRRVTFGFDPKHVTANHYLARYMPQDGVRDSLEAVGVAKNLVLDDGLWYDWDYIQFCPTDFRLLAEDGTQYDFVGSKLSKITDPSGNTLQFTENADEIGFVSSKDPSLDLKLHKTDGKVTSATQTGFPTITYEYDTAGRLETVTDREDRETSFQYDGSSIWISGIVAPGNTVPLIRNEYDADGRILKHIDIDGNEIVYDHRLGERQEVVTDRNGNPTVYEYEERGLVTSVTDPMGRATRYEYNDKGNQTAVIDPLLNRTEYEYDPKGRVTLVRDPLKHESKTTYDDRGNVLTSTDPLQRTTTNTYDDKGRLLTTTDALDTVLVENSWNTDGTLAWSKDELGNTTTFEYVDGRRSRTVYPDGSIERWAYDGQGYLQWESIRLAPSEESLFTSTSTRPKVATEYLYFADGRLKETHSPKPTDDEDSIVTSVTYNALGLEDTRTDGRGNVSRNVYDTQGRLVEVRSVDNDEDQTTSVFYAYDKNGQRILEKDADGRETRLRYDGAGRLIRTSYLDSTFTATAYDKAGRTTATTDRKGNVTRYEYDKAGRQTAVIDPLNRRTVSTYDDAGALFTVTDPALRVTTYRYDGKGRRYQSEFHDGTKVHTEFDTWTPPSGLKGRVERQFDQLDRKTEFRYDWAGRLVEVHQWKTKGVSSSEIVTSYEYDVRGNRTAQVDALDRRTEFEYDRLGRLRLKRWPLVNQSEPREETYEYDANGNLVSKLTPEAQEILYEYDGHDRLMEKSYDDTAFGPWSITYTPSGQRKTVTRGGNLWEWSYEPLNGRLRTFTDPFGRSIDYGYDGNGNRTTVETAQGTTAWRYDPLGRVDRVTDRLSHETVLSYAPTSGLLDQVEYPNGVTTSYGYDPLGRVNSIEHSAGTTTLGSYSYTLGPTGRRNAVSETSAAHSGAVSYSYDDLDRLTGETRTGWPEAYTLSFVYDDVGNRREQTRGSTTRHYLYDERDRLLCENDADDCTTPLVSYAWDAAGRMTDRGSESFSWDPEDRLLEHAGGSTAEFLYDLDGIRYQSATGSTTTEYLVDANRPYQEVLEEWSGTGSQRDLGMEYAHGATGLLWQVDHAASGTPQRYLHGDAQLSTRVLTDTSGATSDAYRLTYEAFGADVAPPSTLPTSYRYTGQQADTTTGGYYLRARYMNPSVGGFLSEDPFAGETGRPSTLHRYRYAALNPINRYDPTGEFEGLLVAVAYFAINLMFAHVPALAATNVPVVHVVPYVLKGGRGWSAESVEAQLSDARSIFSREGKVVLEWDAIWWTTDQRYSGISRYDAIDRLKPLRSRFGRRLPILFTDYFSDNNRTQGVSAYGVGSVLRRCYQHEPPTSPDFNASFSSREEPHLLAHELGHAIADLDEDGSPDNVMNTGIPGSRFTDPQRDQIQKKAPGCCGGR